MSCVITNEMVQVPLTVYTVSFCEVTQKESLLKSRLKLVLELPLKLLMSTPINYLGRGNKFLSVHFCCFIPGS